MQTGRAYTVWERERCCELAEVVYDFVFEDLIDYLLKIFIAQP
jgi:hypothetical protein